MCSNPSDNRFEIINNVKQKLLDSTNIESSEDEKKVVDSILLRLWQIGELTEHISDFPNSSEMKNITYQSSKYRYSFLIDKIKEKIIYTSNSGMFTCDYQTLQSLPNEICRFLIDKGYSITENKIIVSQKNNITTYGYKYTISWKK